LGVHRGRQKTIRRFRPQGNDARVAKRRLAVKVKHVVH